MSFITNWERYHDISRLHATLFLGGAADVCDPDGLEKLGITHVMNLTPDDFPVSEDSRFIVHKLGIQDGTYCPHEKIDEFLRVLHAWQDEASITLVNCHAGISRTSALTSAFLMDDPPLFISSDAVELSWADALSRILHVRPICSPHWRLRESVWTYFGWSAASQQKKYDELFGAENT